MVNSTANILDYHISMCIWNPKEIFFLSHAHIPRKTNKEIRRVKTFFGSNFYHYSNLSWEMYCFSHKKENRINQKFTMKNKLSQNTPQNSWIKIKKIYSIFFFTPDLSPKNITNIFRTSLHCESLWTKSL